jgi:iron complex outermembrane receptor protein
MKLMRTFPLLPALLALANTTQAQQAAPQDNDSKPQTVEVTDKRSPDIEERHDSTVAKIVVGHTEIMKYGDINIGDVLKRLPGVTIGGAGGRTGGEIRMRGLGAGYTQILINGEPAPRGFALDSISPELIERIEIIRGPLAEFSAQAIAGTINIVLRQVPPRRNRQVTLTESLEDNAHPETRLAFQYDNKADKFSWLFSGTIKEMGQLESKSYGSNSIVAPAGGSAPPTVLEDQSTTASDYRTGYNLNIAPRLNWRDSENDTASVQLFAYRRAAVDDSTDTLSDSVGVAPYSSETGHAHNDSDIYKLTIDRVLPLAGGTFTAKFSLSDFHSSVDTHYLQSTEGGPLGLESDSASKVNGANTNGKWSYPIDEHNKFVAGYEGEWTRLTNDLEQNGYIAAAGPIVNDSSATVLRLAGFAQDEWNVSRQWGWYAGLRWESITTHTAASNEESGGDITNRSEVVSPSLQSVWRFGNQMDEKNPDSGYQDQLRWSLSRAYRAPATSSLLPRVFLSTMNTAFQPDTEGNPNLKPELSWGMETALEHYLKGGGMVSLNLFERQVTNVIRTDTTLGANGRWISQPINLDRASLHGIEIDGKMKLDQLIDHAPPVELHANAARYWSNVNSVPGPYNTLSSQTPASANAGFDYTPPGRWSMGTNVTWVPGATTQLSPTQQSYTGGKTGVDGYVLWKFMPGWQARLAATNLWHPDYITAGENNSNGDINTNTTVAHSWVNWLASIDAKF